MRSYWAALLTLTLAIAFGRAEAGTKPVSPPAPGPVQILPGTGSKEPISIDADKLVYYDKEHKAIYSGNVVVIQGDTKMTCTMMTVFLDHAPAQGAKQSTEGPTGPGADAGVKRLEAKGPVTVMSKTQVATGDNGAYDKTEDKVYLIGHVTLSDGQNVTQGDKLTYDLKTGVATVDTSAKSSRVHGQFVPKSSADTSNPGGDAAKPANDTAKAK
jgi:lipopolysaccharide export system protein LptA